MPAETYKKRIIVILLVALVFVTVCFGSCSKRGNVQVYLDWGCYRQTVTIKSSSFFDRSTEPFLQNDWVEGLYFDADFTKAYNRQRIDEDTVIYVKTTLKYPLEKSFYDVDPSLVDDDEVKVLLHMNRGFRFDETLEEAARNAGVDIASVNNNDDYYNRYEQKYGDKFYRGVVIKLSTGGKEKLFEAVKIIMQFPQVYEAIPNHSLPIANGW